MTAEDAINELRKMGSPKNVEGLARFGIKGSRVLGVSVPTIRALGKKAGRSHKLALDLWKTGIHEARLLASMVDIPEKVTEKQLDEWVRDFDSWDVVDQCCGNLFTSTPFAFEKALEWSKRERESMRKGPGSH
jgi:3-methyladenine DNA glycosylase AlkD